MEVTKRFEIALAHRLMQHPGRCKNIHGHNYLIEVTFRGAVNSLDGMVMDFGDIKRKVGAYLDDNLDHSLVLEEADPLTTLLEQAKVGEDLKVVVMECPPTAENMAEMVGQKWCKDGCVRVRIWETSSSYAEWSVDA
jgi:6-pyruvoyltetrahydropterin/6-carboxytetrahydropterin synthase